MPQKARVDQVAALGEHGREVGAAPLQCLAATRARHLHRERHVRLGRGHAQLGQQRDQVGVGALVEDQKARVHPVGANPASCETLFSRTSTTRLAPDARKFSKNCCALFLVNPMVNNFIRRPH
jgi:hypothetical protein